MFKKVLSALFILLPLISKSQDAKSIVEAADRKFKGKSSYSEIKVIIIRPAYTREISLQAWTMENDRLLIKITKPEKDQGTIFLRKGKEVWNWIPSIERTIKLPPSMMSQSWMGSDFTNDDLVKEGSIVSDYNHHLLGSEPISGMDCHRIRLAPLDNSAVVWGAVELWIDKKESMILKANYYDEDGSLVNTMNGSEVKVMSGKTIPSRMEMIPSEDPRKRTILIYEKILFDVGLGDDFFNPQRLQTR